MGLRTLTHFDIAIIGAGQAGLAAAVEAAQKSAYKIALFERQPSAGKKLLLSGGGHCNFSHQGNTADLIEGYHGQGRFLYPALHRYGSQHYIDYLAAHDVQIIVDQRGRYLPKNQRAQTVLDCFLNDIRSQSLAFYTHCTIKKIKKRDETYQLYDQDNTLYTAKSVIFAPGAPCFCHTGSDALGPAILRALNLPLTDLSPALIGIATVETEPKNLSGVTLQNVRLSVYHRRQKKVLEVDQGELLFTHQGLSGPIALNQSRWCTEENIQIKLNLLPEWGNESLAQQLFSLAKKNPQKQVFRQWKNLLPESVWQTLIIRAQSSPQLIGESLGIKKARLIANLATEWTLTPIPHTQYQKGMTVRGGLSLKAIDPKTMMLKTLPGFFVAGDILDLDGKSGGYNLQAAYATGRLAGISAVLHCQNQKKP